MNYVATQYRNVTVTKRGRARRLHPPLRIVGQTAPVDIVLTASIHADDGTVTVIVRQRPLAGNPHHPVGGLGRGTPPKGTRKGGVFCQSGGGITCVAKNSSR